MSVQTDYYIPQMKIKDETISQMAAEITKLRAALTFYADPSAWKATHDPEDAVRIPDFYSETDFGDTASRALGVIATEGQTK